MLVYILTVLSRQQGKTPKNERDRYRELSEEEKNKKQSIQESDTGLYPVKTGKK